MEELNLTATFIANVRGILDARGMSQGELATLLGIKQPSVSAALSGKTAACLDTVGKYAQALGVLPCELLCPSPKKKPKKKSS